MSVCVFTLLACAWVVAAEPASPVTIPKPNVVPDLQEWRGGAGRVKLSRRARIFCPTESAKVLAPIAQLLRDDLQMATGLKLDVVNSGKLKRGDVVLAFSGGDTAFDAEGYSIQITADHVEIRAAKPAGVYYGTRTLLQMLMQSPDKATLPLGEIKDFPQYRHRMLMLDVGRKPFPLPVLKAYLRLMAWYKMNELHLHFSDEAFGGNYTGFRIQCDTFPGLASKDLFYTKKDLRELQDEARRMGITITPEIDMPGHSRVFTDFWPDIMLKGHPNYMDVTNPQTIERMKKLLDEMIPLFDAPDFHIGTDEYRVSGTKEEKEKLHEAFRQFINTMNAHIRSRGKNARIWSGFEHMMGTTEIDPSVTIDMWETDDAKGQIAKGHNIINSNHGRTYIVPGAHYYGVNNNGIYNSWEPWMVSGDMAKNPSKDDPHLLGGKLHVWNDQGPTGYTMSEIASLTLPSLQAFAEKLWGTRGSEDYVSFQIRAALTTPVPGVKVFDRITPKNDDGLVLNIAREQTLATTNASMPLPFAGQPRADLECPWTLTMEVCKTAETGGRGVILSSGLAEICSDFSRTEEKKSKDAAGKEIKTKLAKTGVGVVRAAGSPGADPASSHLANDLSRVYGESLPPNEWVKLTVIGEPRHTTLFVNGEKVGEQREQSLCPLEILGSRTGNSFVGKVRNLKVYNYAKPPGKPGA